MRLNIVAAFAASSLALAAATLGGCAPLTAQNAPLAAAKADLGIDAVCDGVYKGVLLWAQTAHPTPAQAAQARDLQAKVRQAQLAADSAFQLADGTAAEKVAAVESLLIQLAQVTGQPAPSFAGVAGAPAS